MADYTDYDAMVAALRGIDRLLFVSISNPAAQQVVINAAKAAGVQFIAYTSIADPQYNKFGLQDNHHQTEVAIAASGIAHTFLRNGWYLELMQDYLAAAAKNNTAPYFATHGQIAWALKREYAEAGARVIATATTLEVVTLTGEPITYQQLAEATSTAVGRDLQSTAVSRKEFTHIMAQWDISEQGAMLATSYQDYTLQGNNGEASLSPITFEKNSRPSADPNCGRHQGIAAIVVNQSN
ncbi:NmrA family NAD(P)-binding protein [Lacticaseibacillus thailandensis]|uniref:NmrA family NAD(P)-binding protein n=1 Tax=Lacticaseibacillus thailandensis TaxID=381741 RepID=UPI0006CFE06C|nr:NmrA family NAD(P)-binding protein [Lacticaseibacillus thailandensis]